MTENKKLKISVFKEKTGDWILEGNAVSCLEEKCFRCQESCQLVAFLHFWPIGHIRFANALNKSKKSMPVVSLHISSHIDIYSSRPWWERSDQQFWEKKNFGKTFIITVSNFRQSRTTRITQQNFSHKIS